MRIHLLIKPICSAFLLCCLPTALLAHEVAGIKIPAEITLEPGAQHLNLNGAGIRSKFFIKVYVGALYLPVKQSDANKILQGVMPWRVGMHMLHDEVSKEKLTAAWSDGFANNNSAQELAKLNDRLQQFNELFVTMKRGDVTEIDYLPSVGTRVTINGTLRGAIPGEDFQRAVLKVWLGDDPADSSLKRGMLGEE